MTTNLFYLLIIVTNFWIITHSIKNSNRTLNKFAINTIFHDKIDTLKSIFFSNQ